MASDDQGADPAGGRVDRLFNVASTAEAVAAYDAVAGTYVADNMGRGFLLPFVAAGVLARWMGEYNGAILDAGCGTGLVGAALAGMGLGPIAGFDRSEAMLAAAGATGAYAGLIAGDLAGPLPFDDRCFDAVIAAGVFGPGHAPPSALHELNRVAGFGCPIVFTLREDTFRAQGFPAVMDEMTEAGVWRPIHEGPPFPAYLLDKPELKGRAFAFRSTT